MIPTIQSPQNPRFRHWLRVARKGKLPSGQSVLAVEGPKLLEEAVAAGWYPVFLAVTPRGADDPSWRPYRQPFGTTETAVLSRALYEKLADTVTPQEPFALVVPPDPRIFPTATPVSLDELSALTRRVIIADSIQEPGNLGTILRSARAFGFDTVMTTLGSAGLASPKVLRASAGALFRTRTLTGLTPSQVMEWLIAHEFLVVILDPRGSESLETLPWREPLAIVVGNEARGPSEDWAEALRSTDFLRVRIPMAPGSESLNAATAAALAFHAASRALGPPR